MEIPSILYFTAINFVLFVALLFFLLRKPAKQFFADRARALQDQVEATARNEKEINERLQSIQAKLAKIEDEISAIQQQAVAAGEAERDDMIARAEQFAEKSQQETARMVEYELRRSKLELREGLVDAAMQSAEKVLREQLSADDKSRLISQYVKQLGTTH